MGSKQAQAAPLPMILTFLRAAVPLSKTLTYSARDDLYATSHYPMVRKMTSLEVPADDMWDFRKAIVDQGEKGLCLMFGQLTQPLKDESRADKTVKGGDHDWIMFDFDKVDAEPSIEGALDAIARYLPECCQAAECVIQLSPSCFVPTATKLSCHVFMRLSKPEKASRLKEFITWINFTNAELLAQARLTESLNTLSLKLDRCVTDPSRLIYIAPPRTIGFKPPFTVEESIQHFEGEPSFAIPDFKPIERSFEQGIINDKRRELGMEERQLRTIKFLGVDVIQGTESGVISDVKPSGPGYIRFNINGGDSHAYWIELTRPELIGNFKGEHYILTKDVDEDFYNKLVGAIKQMPKAPRGSDGTDVLAFYATNHGSQLYIGTYDRAKDVLRVDPSSETPALSWLRQFGVPTKALLPHYDLTHDISSNVRYEEGYPVINLYARTNMMKQYAEAPKRFDTKQTFERLKETCPVIMMFAQSMCGDARSTEGFINWLAFIFQYRIKAETAWLLWGTEGTGKGKFLQHVCRPLFGENNVSQVLMSNVDSTFNALLEGKLLVNIDEAEMSRTRDKPEAMSKLRNWITEPTIVVNKKNVTEREVPSFANFIITANSFRPLMISAGDRRFHVGLRQDTRLLPTANEHAILVQGEELPAFARALGELIVDENWVRNPELTEQKARLFESTHSLVDNVGMAIQEGDSSFFFEARPAAVALGTTTSTAMMPIKQYDDLLRAMADKTLNVLRQEDLYVLFNVVVNDSKQFPENATIQKQIYNRYGLLDDKRSRYCARSKRAVYGASAPEWNDVPEYLLEVLGPQMPTHADNVTPMRSKKT